MATPILLPPKVDFVFKRIFGNEKHPNVLISFLNAVLTPVDPIKKVTLKDTTIEKESLESKFSRLDVKATTDKGEEINIEIQVKDEGNMIQRSLYYWSRIYHEQIKKGDDYEQLSRTICINLLNFNLLDTTDYHSVYRLKECRRNTELTDLIELHFIELKKMKNVNRIEDVNSQLEAWLHFINHPESDLVQALEQKNQELKEAKEELIRLSGDEKERQRYNKRMETLSNEKSALRSAEEKGIKKGIAQGIEQGIEQGAKLEKIEIAKNAIKNGFDNETIIKLTGLSLAEVERLRKE